MERGETMKRLTELLIVCFVFMLIGCGMAGSDWKAYNIANNEFTEIAVQYDAYYSVATAEDQARWKTNFDPVFDEGDKTLTNWRGVLDAGEDPAAQATVFNAIKQRIIMILFKFQED